MIKKYNSKILHNSTILKHSIFVIFILFAMQVYAFAQSDTLKFIKGADISFLPQIEDSGGVFKDEGVAKDALEIFEKYGLNYIRLKIWHTPEEDYNNLPRILEMAQRIKDKNFKFLLNFHYSDTWADPGNQTKPVAWQGISFTDLTDSVYAYTKNVIEALEAQNTTPDMVQIGNEINGGMLWNEGRVGGSYNNWSNLADLLNAGISGVRDGAVNGDSIKIMIHRADAADYGGNDWFFGNLNSYSIDFDIIGLSYYPWWHGTLSQVQSTLNSLVNKYGKDIIIAETAYPWTFGWNDNVNNIVWEDADLPEEYPASKTGQSNFLRDLMQIVGNVNNQKGKGIFYWEPDYISAPNMGSPWENLALFDFDGDALQAMNVFTETPDSLVPVNATIIVNTSTNWDTLQENHFVQLRGKVEGISYGTLPDGKKITLDASSDLVMNKIGGDYWKVDFQIYPGDILSYKIWTGTSVNTPTFLRGGWEGAVIAFNGTPSNYRNLVVGDKDTIIAVQYYNSSPENRAQYWQPFDHKEDSVAIYFRVNMDKATSSGRFNPEINGPLSVRGDSAASGGMLSWQNSNIILSHEEISVNSGSFWSGVGYLPKSALTVNTTFHYKFFIENDIYNGWENNIPNRELLITESLLNSYDSTLHWVYFDDNIVSSIKSDREIIPQEIKLFQNFPNPFNPKTVISYRLKVKSEVELSIYNLQGQKVATLVNENQTTGKYEIEWDASSFSSGVYLCRLQTKNSAKSIKVLLLK